MAHIGVYNDFSYLRIAISESRYNSHGEEASNYNGWQCFASFVLIASFAKDLRIKQNIEYRYSLQHLTSSLWPMNKTTHKLSIFSCAI